MAKTHYLNTDLDVVTRRDPAPLIAMMEHLGVPALKPPMKREQDDGAWFVIFEIMGRGDTIESTVIAVLAAVEKLTGEAREIWYVATTRELNLDHVIPLSRGGTSCWENVVCACIVCNTRKSDRTPREAGMRLVRRPRKPVGHPMLRANWLGPCPEEWKTFLDEAYWNVELHDEVMSHSPIEPAD